MARILVIEDDPDTADEIIYALRSHGHEVAHVADGLLAVEQLLREPFDLVTLDRMLPGLDGLALVARLRERRLMIPVLMISALSDVDERIAGLRAGGDDYLIKPFVPDEMVMRVEVLLRRRQGSVDAVLQCGNVALDIVSRQVTVGGEPVRLLHMEFRLLELFMRHAGNTLSRRIIFEQVWGYHFDPGPNLINVHIAKLRKKLDRPAQQSVITTVKGEGYRFDAI
jgi:two-component system OmpR family response regulator